MRSRWFWIALGLGLIAAVSVGWGRLEELRFRRELRAAQREMDSGLYRLARQRLSVLEKSRPGSTEAAYQLGLCEESLGRGAAAIEAWSHIPAAGPWGPRAAIGRARVLVNTGRFAPAEAELLTVPAGSGTESRLARRALLRLYHIEGRTSEVRELTLEDWADAAEPDAVLQTLYQVDRSAFPIDRVRNAIESADPDDDRVWLARANLAAWTGQVDEAARWLARCVERRPDDEPVWRARLELARATGDVEAVRLAASHLPAARFRSVELLELRAWIAAQSGDPALEQRALVALVDIEPGNIGAWDRLAELALRAGRKSEAEECRRRKAESNDLRVRYKKLLDRDDRAAHARELAGLAERLGWRAEARGWTAIAEGRAATEPLLSEADLADRPGSTRKLDPLIADLVQGRRFRSPGSPSSQPGSVPRFVDAAAASGLRFVHDNGHRRRNPPPPEAMCGGVALLDFDGDGWLDVYVVQGGPFPPPASPAAQGDCLFRGRGDGTFEDVTEQTGIGSFPGGYGHGVTVGDYDNDGRPDLFVTRWRSYALYHNRGGGRFEDVTESGGLGGDRDWPTSAAFADLDNDGDLDLYVCHYLLYDPANPRRCEHPDSPSKHECYPIDFRSLPDHVFRNDGGRFVDVTAEAGFVDPDGRGLGVVAGDLDDDGRIDLYVANDMTANYLFHNRGGFRFEEVGQVSGSAASADGGFKAGMGIALGDLDGDGLLDLGVTNYFGESTTYYHNLGQLFFADHSAAINLAAPTRRLLGFGIAFLDADNDGRLDVLSANGHVLDARPQIPWTMPLQLLRGSEGGRLVDVSRTAGEPFVPLRLGRGLAVGDLDNDGRLDAVVVSQNEPLVYLHNQTPAQSHFIAFSVQGTRSNRDGVGTRITTTAGGRRRSADRSGGGSYQSASDPRVHFGLGEATIVDLVEIRWPSGHVDRHLKLQADRQYELREGESPVAVRRGGGASARRGGSEEGNK
jgi:tetratricopeptide (TPR) repeat protein